MKGNVTAVERQYGLQTTKAAGSPASGSPSRRQAPTTPGRRRDDPRPGRGAVRAASSPYTSNGITTVDGHRWSASAAPSRRHTQARPGRLTGTATLYILAAAPYTPVEFTITGLESRRTAGTATSTEKETVTFSGWAHPPSPSSAPAGAIPVKTVAPGHTTRNGKPTTGPPVTSTAAPPRPRRPGGAVAEPAADPLSAGPPRSRPRARRPGAGRRGGVTVQSTTVEGTRRTAPAVDHQGHLVGREGGGHLVGGGARGVAVAVGAGHRQRAGPPADGLQPPVAWAAHPDRAPAAQQLAQPLDRRHHHGERAGPVAGRQHRGRARPGGGHPADLAPPADQHRQGQVGRPVLGGEDSGQGGRSVDAGRQAVDGVGRHGDHRAVGQGGQHGRPGGPVRQVDEARVVPRRPPCSRRVTRPGPPGRGAGRPGPEPPAPRRGPGPGRPWRRRAAWCGASSTTTAPGRASQRAAPARTDSTAASPGVPSLPGPATRAWRGSRRTSGSRPDHSSSADVGRVGHHQVDPARQPAPAGRRTRSRRTA